MARIVICLESPSSEGGHVVSVEHNIHGGCGVFGEIEHSSCMEEVQDKLQSF